MGGGTLSSFRHFDHLSTDDIAGRLCISPATAETHIQNILRRTALHSRRDLMLLPPAR